MSKTLQLVHNPSLFGSTAADKVRGLTRLKEQGVGGIVTNVAFKGYLTSEDGWRELLDLLSACRTVNMRVWIYDERGYPSGSAGGLVLANDPDLEARAMALDEGRVFEERPYEGTHNCHNYHERRRYINLLDRRATAEFVNVTHRRYRSRLDGRYWPVEAFFTDEPALNTVNLGTLPEAAEKTLPIHDQPDPNKKRCPMIPWSDALAGQVDPAPIFSDAPAARSAKRDYYRRVADAVSENYFGQIQEWCHDNGTLSSGHLLQEENILDHAELYGNALRCLMRMDIPGIDVLDSNPAASFRHSHRAALLASSAAMLNGTRRIMTEVSDFMQRMDENRLAEVPAMQATAAWQAALGVTEFTLYYSWDIPDPNPFLPAEVRKKGLFRPATEYLEYNRFVTALVEQLEPCRLVPDVFLYYPIELVQEQIVPSELPRSRIQFSARLQAIRDSFNRAMDELLRAGVVPCLVDEAMIRSAEMRDDGIHILNACAQAIVFPKDCVPPGMTAEWEFSENTPQALFAAGKTRMVNQNPSVFVAAMEAADELVFTCVNLDKNPQTCGFRTRSGVENLPLGGYETTVLRRPKGAMSPKR